MRKCNTCGYVGPLEDFVPAKRYKYGVRPNCRKCFNQETRKQKGYNLNKPYERRKDQDSVYIKKWDIKRRTPEEIRMIDAVNILIKNGYAKNEEEAREYAKW